MALLISLVTTILNKKFIDSRQLMEWQQEVGKWNDMRNRARKTGDKKLYARVKRQEPRILQIQSKMFKQQMKTTAVTIVPFSLLFFTIPGYFGTEPVAYIPLLNDVFPLPFFYWYIICSFFIGTILRRLTGIGAGMGTGMGTGMGI